MDSADRACRHLLPNGGRMTVAQQQQALKHALKFSACMRAHGLPDFPDPSAAGGGVVMNLHGTGLSPPVAAIPSGAAGLPALPAWPWWALSREGRVRRG